MVGRRKVSIFIPYKIRDGKILVYLQKRSKDATRLPDFFGFFGGGIENNESPEKALLREIVEEMNFKPSGYQLLGSFWSFKYVFILEVEDDFEEKIKVLEGEFGKYFNEKEALGEPKLIEEDKAVLRYLYKFLREK